MAGRVRTLFDGRPASRPRHYQQVSPGERIRHRIGLPACSEIGSLKVGTVSVDGTKIDVNASKDKNVRYDRAGELDRQLEAGIRVLLEKVEHADKSEACDGRSLPEE